MANVASPSPGRASWSYARQSRQAGFCLCTLIHFTSIPSPISISSLHRFEIALPLPKSKPNKQNVRLRYFVILLLLVSLSSYYSSGFAWTGRRGLSSSLAQLVLVFLCQPSRCCLVCCRKVEGRNEQCVFLKVIFSLKQASLWLSFCTSVRAQYKIRLQFDIFIVRTSWPLAPSRSKLTLKTKCST